MKRILIIANLVILSAFVAIADGVDTAKQEAEALAKQVKKTVSKEEAFAAKRAEIEKRPEVLRKTGGFLDVPASGTALVIVDMRKKAGGAPDRFGEVFSSLSKMNVFVDKKPLAEGTCANEQLAKQLSDNKGVYGLAVIDCKKAAGLTVIPDDRLVIVNADKYKGGDDPLASEIRIIKQLWRGLGFVSGIGFAPFENDVFHPIYSIEELDALTYQVMQPLNFQKMYKELSNFGIARARHIPYRVAVIEGWASPPTNDYQKVVWQEAKAWLETNKTNRATAPLRK